MAAELWCSALFNWITCLTCGHNWTKEPLELVFVDSQQVLFAINTKQSCKSFSINWMDALVLANKIFAIESSLKMTPLSEVFPENVFNSCKTKQTLNCLLGHREPAWLWIRNILLVFNCTPKNPASAVKHRLTTIH